MVLRKNKIIAIMAIMGVLIIVLILGLIPVYMRNNGQTIAQQTTATTTKVKTTTTPIVARTSDIKTDGMVTAENSDTSVHSNLITTTTVKSTTTTLQSNSTRTSSSKIDAMATIDSTVQLNPNTTTTPDSRTDTTATVKNVNTSINSKTTTSDGKTDAMATIESLHTTINQKTPISYTGTYMMATDKDITTTTTLVNSYSAVPTTTNNRVASNMALESTTKTALKWSEGMRNDTTESSAGTSRSTVSGVTKQTLSTTNDSSGVAKNIPLLTTSATIGMVSANRSDTTEQNRASIDPRQSKSTISYPNKSSSINPTSLDVPSQTTFSSSKNNRLITQPRSYSPRTATISS